MGADQRSDISTPMGVTIDAERDDARGWVFEAEVSWKGAGTSTHEVTLAWVDHDALSGGAEPPSALARRAVMVAARALGREGLPERFDLASVRRRIPDFERLVTTDR